MHFLEALRGSGWSLTRSIGWTTPPCSKNAADHYPDVRILATGSSRISASPKFRDSLTGRKCEVLLRPLVLPTSTHSATPIWRTAGCRGDARAFLATQLDDAFREWIDSFWANDVEELFPVEQYGPFRRFVELLLADSGGMFEASRFATACELSRPTISNHLGISKRRMWRRRAALHQSARRGDRVGAACLRFRHRVRRVLSRLARLRSEEMGALWEHFVLNELLARADLDRSTTGGTSAARGRFHRRAAGRDPSPSSASGHGYVPVSSGLTAFRRAYPTATTTSSPVTPHGLCR